MKEEPGQTGMCVCVCAHPSRVLQDVTADLEHKRIVTIIVVIIIIIIINVL